MPATSYRACLLDALGTTVRLLPPWEGIDPALVDGLGADRVREEFLTEMTYYGAHAHEASDPERLGALRRRCAELLSEGLGRQVSVEQLMGSIAFEAYKDAAPAMDDMRELGLKLICVSNWDCDLPAVLERVGLAGHFDGVVASALVGARKPDPEIFRRALTLAGCDRAQAIHVGDSPDDVEGARAAGIDVLRIDREGGGDLASLSELVSRLRSRPMDQLGPPGRHIGQDSRR